MGVKGEEEDQDKITGLDDEQGTANLQKKLNVEKNGAIGVLDLPEEWTENLNKKSSKISTK